MVRRVNKSRARRWRDIKGEPLGLFGPVAGIEHSFLAKSKVQPDATQGVTIAASGHGDPVDDCQALLGQQPQIGPGRQRPRCLRRGMDRDPGSDHMRSPADMVDVVMRDEDGIRPLQPLDMEGRARFRTETHVQKPKLPSRPQLDARGAFFSKARQDLDPWGRPTIPCGRMKERLIKHPASPERSLAWQDRGKPKDYGVTGVLPRLFVRGREHGRPAFQHPFPARGGNVRPGRCRR